MLNEMLIGGRIAEGRKEQKLSQAQLAQKLCVSPQAVSKWERGESMPDIITLDRIAKLFNKDVTFFTQLPESADGENYSESFLEDEQNAGHSARDFKKAQDADAAQNGEEEANKGPTLNMSCASWRDADFSGLKNIGDKFNFSNVINCKFKDSDLAGTRFNGNNIKDCDFTLASLEYSAVRGSNIVGNRFDGGNLQSIKIHAANIKNCSFTGTNLTRSEFKSTLIHGCDFTGAKLDGARLKLCNIKDANLENVFFHGTELDCCNFSGITVTGDMTECSLVSCTFKNTLFKNVTFKNCFFKGGDMFRKMMSKAQFEGCKADKLSYEFLKACKADLGGIELV